MEYVGTIELEGTLSTLLMTRPATRVPTNADATPTARVFQPSAAMAVTPTITHRQSGSITGATNASPIEITSAAHGLLSGQRVTITGVVGNTAANGTFVITKTGDNTFTLNGSTGNGAYSSGGNWVSAGLYKVALACTTANGFVRGQIYQILFNYAISSTQFAHTQNFLVR